MNQNKETQRTKYRSEYPKDFKFDYKDPVTLALFISDGGRMISPRLTRLSLIQQRKLKRCIKKARVLSLLPMGFEAYNRFIKVEQISARKFDIESNQEENFKDSSQFHEFNQSAIHQSPQEEEDHFFQTISGKEFENPPLTDLKHIEKDFETKIDQAATTVNNSEREVKLKPSSKPSELKEHEMRTNKDEQLKLKMEPELKKLNTEAPPKTNEPSMSTEISKDTESSLLKNSEKKKT